MSSLTYDFLSNVCLLIASGSSCNHARAMPPRINAENSHSLVELVKSCGDRMQNQKSKNVHRAFCPGDLQFAGGGNSFYSKFHGFYLA